MNLLCLRTMILAGLVAICFQAKAGGPAFADFKDGGASEGNFTANPVRGATTQPIGRVAIQPTANSPTLLQMNITLGGASRTGLSNLKLWNTFNSTFTTATATQFGSTVAADPGAGTMSFSGSHSNISNFYLFLTGDIASNATGTVSPVVTGVTMQVTDTLTGFNGSGNDPMANSDPVFLPVTLSGFRVD